MGNNSIFDDLGVGFRDITGNDPKGDAKKRIEHEENLDKIRKDEEGEIFRKSVRDRKKKFISDNKSILEGRASRSLIGQLQDSDDPGKSLSSRRTLIGS